MYTIIKAENSSCYYRKIENNAVRLIWEITGRCNLNCVHCFANVNSDAGFSKNELTTSEALHIIEQFKDINVGKVLLTGGEPLLRKDIELIIQNIRKQSDDIIIDLQTNGLLINDNLIACLKENAVKELSISLDGPQNTYRRVRGQNVDFQKLLKNIENLTALGIIVSCAMVLNKETIDTLEETIELAKSVGVSCLTIANLVRIEISNFDYESLKITEQQKNDVFAKVHSLQDKYRDNPVVRTIGFQACTDSDNCPNRNIIAINRNGMYLRCLSTYKEGYSLLNSRDYSLKEAHEML